VRFLLEKKEEKHVIFINTQILINSYTKLIAKFFFIPICQVLSKPNSSVVPTFQEFSSAVVKNGYKTPKITQYKNFINGLSSKGGINSKREAAMFLANILQESAGLTRIIEDRCGKGCFKCPADYKDRGDSAGVRYCGRGYIQLVS